MKLLKHITLIAIAIVTLMACGGGTSSQDANAQGFSAIENDIKSKFGDNAYYTDLNISYDTRIGNMISLTVTDAPESLKMGQWVQSQNTWKQTSEVTLEVPEGTKAEDFMFQLDDNINLNRLGELVEKSCAQLTTEKDIENPKLEMAFVKFPKNGDISKAQYSISLKPEQGGTTFSFYYKLNGELIEMNY